MTELQGTEIIILLTDIRTFLNAFLVILGILISYFLARWIWKSLILSTIRSFIKFKI